MAARACYIPKTSDYVTLDDIFGLCIRDGREVKIVDLKFRRRSDRKYLLQINRPNSKAAGDHSVLPVDCAELLVRAAICCPRCQCRMCRQFLKSCVRYAARWSGRVLEIINLDQPDVESRVSRSWAQQECLYGSR